MKLKVKPEEMRKLTEKNYRNLPEVREKMKKEQKRKEMQNRLQNAKEYELVFSCFV